MKRDRFRVLIIEDDEMLRDATEFAFRRYPDIKVVCADDGIQALFKLSNEPFDALLTDVMMPRMRGDDMIETLIKKNIIKDLEVFMMSASMDHDVINKVKGHIVKAFVKPIDPNEVVDCIYQHLYMKKK